MKSVNPGTDRVAGMALAWDRGGVRAGPCVHTCSPCPVRLSATPGTAARQDPLSMGFSKQGHWSGLPFPPPGDLPNSRSKLASPALQAASSPLSHQGSHGLLENRTLPLNTDRKELGNLVSRRQALEARERERERERKAFRPSHAWLVQERGGCQSVAAIQ